MSNKFLNRKKLPVFKEHLIDILLYIGGDKIVYHNGTMIFNIHSVCYENQNCTLGQR